jgi:hypothetical protein
MGGSTSSNRGSNVSNKWPQDRNRGCDYSRTWLCGGPDGSLDGDCLCIGQFETRLKEDDNIRDKAVGTSINPRRYTIRMILEMLPTAPRAITMLTDTLDRVSRSLSIRTEIGTKTKVQSAITLSVPYKYPEPRMKADGKQCLEPDSVSAILAGFPQAKIAVRTYMKPYVADTPRRV